LEKGNAGFWKKRLVSVNVNDNLSSLRFVGSNVHPASCVPTALLDSGLKPE
jgi:hypothetical protein